MLHKHPLFSQQLLDMLKFYTGFEINDVTGMSMDKKNCYLLIMFHGNLLYCVVNVSQTFNENLYCVKVVSKIMNAYLQSNFYAFSFS